MKKHLFCFCLIAIGFVHPAFAQTAPWQLADFLPRLSAFLDEAAPGFLEKNTTKVTQTSQTLEVVIWGFPVKAIHDGVGICQVDAELLMKDPKTTDKKEQTEHSYGAFLLMATLAGANDPSFGGEGALRWIDRLQNPRTTPDHRLVQNGHSYRFTPFDAKSGISGRFTITRFYDCKQ